MIELFTKTLRSLTAEIASFGDKNNIGEPIKTTKTEPFTGAIFSSSARDFALGGDVTGVEYSHKMYSTKNFTKNDIVRDDVKKYEVV